MVLIVLRFKTPRECIGNNIYQKQHIPITNINPV